MSVEEEVELRDLVAQTLELNGCLPKIRAQLRANLFLALDEDSKISKQRPLLNTKIKSYLEAPEGQLMFCLVREFLEYFDLDFTASVYDPESYVGSYYKYEGRQKIIEDLGIKPTEDNYSGPVLLHLVKIAQMKTKTLKINLNLNGGEQKDSNDGSSVVSLHDDINGYSLSENEKNSVNSLTCHKTEEQLKLTPEIKTNGEVSKNNLNATFVKKDVENDDTFNGTSSIEEESVNGGIENSQDTNQKSNEDEDGTSTEQGSSPEAKSKSDDKSKSMKSEKLKPKLELPPLQLNKPRGSDLLPSLYNRDFKDKLNKEYDFEIKDDYEEDFLSGSELDFSRGKLESPKPLSEELKQVSEPTTNGSSHTSMKKYTNIHKEHNSQHTNSDKFTKSHSTDNIETNISFDEEISTSKRTNSEINNT